MNRAHPAYYLFFYLPSRIAINTVRSVKIDNLFKHIVLGLFVCGVAWAEYAFFSRFWELLGGIPFGFSVLLPRFISLTGSFFFLFLSYSSILTTLSSLYQSSDMVILLTMPIRLSWVIFLKMGDIWMRSSNTLILLSLPPMFSLGIYLNLPWLFYGVYLFHVLAISLIAVSVGTALGMILMACFPARRLHQTIAIIGLCIASLLIAGVRFLHLETLWAGNAMENPLLVFLQSETGLIRYSPAALFAGGILPHVSGEGGVNLFCWISGALGLGAVGMALLLGQWIFLPGWFRLQVKGDSVIGGGYARGHVPFRWLSAFPGFRGLMVKDYAVFRRDPSIWTQVFMMLPLGVLCIINLYFLPLHEIDAKPLFAMGILALVGLVVAAMGARYLFPAASREGRAVWVVACSPFSPTVQVWQKVLFSAPPVIALGMVLMLFSALALELEGWLLVQTLCICAGMCVQLCVMAVCLGYCYPHYKYRHLLEVSLGKGSLLFMLLAVIEIGSLDYVLWLELVEAESGTMDIFVPRILIWGAVWLGITAVCYVVGCGRCRYPDL